MHDKIFSQFKLTCFFKDGFDIVRYPMKKSIGHLTLVCFKIESRRKPHNLVTISETMKYNHRFWIAINRFCMKNQEQAYFYRSFSIYFFPFIIHFQLLAKNVYFIDYKSFIMRIYTFFLKLESPMLGNINFMQRM